METNIDQVESFVRRPRLYNNIDGVVELGGGVMLLGYALLLWLKAWAPAHSFWDEGVFYLWIALMCGVHFGMKAIKSRITYPRTGFVEYRRPRGIPAAALAALIPLVMVAAYHRHWDVSTAAYFFGLAFATSFAYHIARAARWKWIAVGTIVLGSIMIAFVPADNLAAVASISLAAHPVGAKLVGILLLSFLTYGLILLVSGSISFWLYLRHTHAAAREGQ
jgi:hypothetical protein